MTKKISNSSQNKDFLKKSFLLGIAGGAIGALLISVVLSIKNTKSPLSGFGMVNRESIIQGKAKDIAKLKVSESELVDKLTAFIELYDGVVRDLMNEKQVLLLDKNAFASVDVPNFTEEVRNRLHKIESQKK